MQAWEHGPVQTEVYTNFKYNREIFISNISSPIGDFEEFIIDTIYEMTKNLSPQKLIEISHEPNKAWHKVFIPNVKYIKISKQSIKEDVPNQLLKMIDSYFKEKRRYDKNLVSKEILNLEFLNG